MTPAFTDDFVSIYHGDAWELAPTLAPQSVNCIVTSPPYWGLRDYGVDGQLGLEPTPDEYVARLVNLFALLRPALTDDGTVWLNLGDSYQNKSLAMIPARVSIALGLDGWFIRSEIVWAKTNGMPGSQTDRPTSSHESIYLLTKAPRYWSDFDAIKTPPKESSMVRLAQDTQAQAGSHRANGGGKTNGPMKAVGGKQRGHSRRHAGFNERWDQMTKSEQQAQPAIMRDVWFVAPEASTFAHFAMMPREIARRCILAGCPEGGTVLDPFIGSGTTAQVARSFGRKCIGFEINPEYIALAARERLAQGVLL